jgi:hypothetical protein
MPNATKPRQRRSPSASKAGKPAVQEQGRLPRPGADPATEAASGPAQTPLTPEQRRQLISTRAYQRAERRGFSGGSPEQDWLEAEAELDAAMASSRIGSGSG